MQNHAPMLTPMSMLSGMNFPGVHLGFSLPYQYFSYFFPFPYRFGRDIGRNGDGCKGRFGSNNKP